MSGFIPQPRVLDACCGSRMFWFDRAHPDALFVDNRRETHVLRDKSSSGGSRSLIIDPDIQADFADLPFPNETFSHVVFDPPHLVRNGKTGWLAKKYGKLEGDWRAQLTAGFSECFRVLKEDGTLVFKWNDNDVPVSEILALTPVRKERQEPLDRFPEATVRFLIVYFPGRTGNCSAAPTFHPALNTIIFPLSPQGETPHPNDSDVCFPLGGG
jgi:SAM-dependent methyltransferase